MSTRDSSRPVEHFAPPPDFKTPLRVGVGDVTLWPMRHVLDKRGNLIPVEFEQDLPFVPRRQFLIHGVEDDRIRGEHAHQVCHQFLFAVVGSLSVIVDDGIKACEVELADAAFGLYMPPYTWGVQYRFTPHTMLSVYASHPYDAAEYIRDYDDFLAQVRHRTR
ncbi:MAG TPA: FdtA/QdtA family cupin domain-containing protein [Gammaproteobacteria bacterium]|nr:FdtA/QdtA family cupin domain-containing protein [Gammaproteobacteria bacterium]